VLPGIDREIFSIVIKSSRRPGWWYYGMSGSRCRIEPLNEVICGGIIIGLMTTDTGVRSVCINPVMTLVTTGRDMCAGKRPVSIVYCECGRFPAGRVV